MANPIASLLEHKHAIGKLALFLALPWVWAAPFVAWWVSAAALIVTALIAVAGVRFLLAPEAKATPPSPPARAGEDAEQSRAVRRASRPLRRLLARWAGITQSSSTELAESQSALQDVIQESETAVLEISKSFRNITSRSSQQIAYAMGLLRTTRGPGDVSSGDHSSEDMSLPEYIRAYEVLLNFALDRLNDFAHDALSLVEQAEKGGPDSIEGKLLMDRVRRLAQETQPDTEQLRADAVHLSGGMVIKNQQVMDVLRHINSTAQDIRRDVNQLVMAMQFQDITQQKLERVRGPLMSEIIKALNSITDETRVLSKQLKAGAVSVPDAALPETQLEPAAPQKNESAPVAAKERQASTGSGEGSSVELF